MTRQWWKQAVVYQIYPRSFNDSNGDGIGDIRGIIGKLDYLKELGVDVVWLSPVYTSPNDDNGYDISDYKNIMDEFGTMADWDEMLAEMHKKGIKLIMDLVVNHSSDEHAWFVESRKSKDNPYRDYYIWKPGKEQSIYTKGRDNARTPIQWNDKENAGFTEGTPWIKVNPNYKEINAEQAVADPESIFHYYKKLIELRKEHEIIVFGSFDMLYREHEQIFAYTRTLGDEKLLVVTNFSGNKQNFVWEAPVAFEEKEVLISNYPLKEKEDISRFELRPWEARVYKLGSVKLVC